MAPPASVPLRHGDRLTDRVRIDGPHRRTMAAAGEDPRDRLLTIFDRLAVVVSRPGSPDHLSYEEAATLPCVAVTAGACRAVWQNPDGDGSCHQRGGR